MRLNEEDSTALVQGVEALKDYLEKFRDEINEYFPNISSVYFEIYVSRFFKLEAHWTASRPDEFDLKTTFRHGDTI